MKSGLYPKTTYLVIFLISGLFFILTFVLTNKKTGLIQKQLTSFARIPKSFLNDPETKIYIEENPKDIELADFYLQHTSSKKKFLIMTLDHVLPIGIKDVQLSHGRIFVIKKIPNPTLPDINDNTELWVFDQNHQPKKIFSHKHFEYLVSPDGELISIITNKKVVFTKSNGQKINEFSLLNIEPKYIDNKLSFSLVKWSTDSQKVWGRLEQQFNILSYFTIDSDYWYVEYYDISNLGITNRSELDLNPDLKKIVFSQYPFLFDANRIQVLIENKQEFTLYLYDLVTKEKIPITTSIGRDFHPKWTNLKQFEYNNPTNHTRSLYSL